MLVKMKQNIIWLFYLLICAVCFTKISSQKFKPEIVYIDNDYFNFSLELEFVKAR